MTANFRRPLAPRARGFSHLIAFAALLTAGACTFTPPEPPPALKAPPPSAVNRLTLDQYRDAVARRIVARNPS
jgi:protein TonB